MFFEQTRELEDAASDLLVQAYTYRRFALEHPRQYRLLTECPLQCEVQPDGLRARPPRAFIEQLGRASGFASHDPPAVRLEKLNAVLARAGLSDEDVAFLADLLALQPLQRRPLSNLSPGRKKERTLEALIRQL